MVGVEPLVGRVEDLKTYIKALQKMFGWVDVGGVDIESTEKQKPIEDEQK